MARYFFHFINGGEHSPDEFGLTFASAEQALIEASRAVLAMWPELLAARQDPMACAFEIADENGTILFDLPFSEALDRCRRPSGGPASASITAALPQSPESAAAAKIRPEFQQFRISRKEPREPMQKLSFASMRDWPAHDRRGSDISGSN